MEGILPEQLWRDKERLYRELQTCSDVKRKTRLLVIINLMLGRSVPMTVAVLQN